jgi:hypothetical protein
VVAGVPPANLPEHSLAVTLIDNQITTPNFTIMKTRVSFVLVAFSFVCVGVLRNAQAVNPPPDGGYPGKNTAEGQDALFSLTTGHSNSANGFAALKANTTGDRNTANGAFALFSNQTGSENTATGYAALFLNRGSLNTANGVGALHDNATGSNNTANGQRALYENLSGSSNTANGSGALNSNTMGDNNTAIGFQALTNNTTGSSNIGLGRGAGSGVTTADDVICIGTAGANVSHSCYIGNIFNQSSPSGLAVFVNSDGKLGTILSSRRFKEHIKPMDKVSEAILALQPVMFRYKKDFDPTGTAQFGLVAEDVAKVNPDLVVRDKEGKPNSVRYDQVNAMLLNEFLKEHHQVQDLKGIVAEQQKQIEALTAGLQKVSTQVELSRPAPHAVVTNE